MVTFLWIVFDVAISVRMMTSGYPLWEVGIWFGVGSALAVTAWIHEYREEKETDKRMEKLQETVGDLRQELSEARTTPHSRAGLVRRVNAGELAKTVAAGVGVCDKTVRKWAGRFSREGAAGLVDRSSRPHRLRCPTAPEVAEQVIALRRQRLLMKHIAAQLELSIATVSRLLKRVGLSRLSALDPPLLIQRYEYSAPGDLLHLDTKKVGRFHRVDSSITALTKSGDLGAGFEVTTIEHGHSRWPQEIPPETSARKPPPVSSCAQRSSRRWGSRSRAS